jgi:hypothetical protein
MENPGVESKPERVQTRNVQSISAKAEESKKYDESLTRGKG